MIVHFDKTQVFQYLYIQELIFSPDHPQYLTQLHFTKRSWIEMNKTLINLSLAAIVLTQSFASQAAQSNLIDNVNTAMKMDYRTEADTKRDRNRSPAQALTFFGFEQNVI